MDEHKINKLIAEIDGRPDSRCGYTENYNPIMRVVKNLGKYDMQYALEMSEKFGDTLLPMLLAEPIEICECVLRAHDLWEVE